mmetsp:Transcript_30271/g.50084  ORF Transcript_30271/g.50084 Transcript_30271/m.50084 type:complete len:256 (-) Transcript_30271:592-1359(-)
MSRQEAYQLYSEQMDCGKHIKSSKKRIRWRWCFGADASSTAHELVVVHSLVSQKKVIKLDGEQVLNSKKAMKNFQQTFTLGQNNLITVEINADIDTEYVLLVNGTRFEYLPRFDRAGLHPGGGGGGGGSSARSGGGGMGFAGAARAVQAANAFRSPLEMQRHHDEQRSRRGSTASADQGGSKDKAKKKASSSGDKKKTASTKKKAPAAGGVGGATLRPVAPAAAQAEKANAASFDLFTGTAAPVGTRRGLFVFTK